MNRKEKHGAWLMGVTRGLLFCGLIAAGAPALAMDEADRQLCEKYRERLESFERNGVMAYNARTGNLERMTEEQAQVVIRQTRERIAQLCR